MCVIYVGGAHPLNPPQQHTHTHTLARLRVLTMTKARSSMASWQRTQPLQLHQRCRAQGGGVESACISVCACCLNPWAQLKERAVNTNTRCCVREGRRCVNRLEVARDATNNRCRLTTSQPKQAWSFPAAAQKHRQCRSRME